MNLSIQQAKSTDEDTLWVMLYYAAHMQWDGATSLFAARDVPYLARYVAGWGGPTDLGVIGFCDQQPIGAVWSRLLLEDERTPSYIDDETPELAAAVLPEFVGQGIGTKLLTAYLDLARALFPAVVLSVRADNPAHRLYQRVGFQTLDTIVNRVGGKSYTMLYKFR